MVVSASRVADAFGPKGSLGLAGLGQQRAELLAAVAADHVGGPAVPRRRLADGLEGRVAGRVAVQVVDPLEEVEIHHHARQRQAITHGACHAFSSSS